MPQLPQIKQNLQPKQNSLYLHEINGPLILHNGSTKPTYYYQRQTIKTPKRVQYILPVQPSLNRPKQP